MEMFLSCTGNKKITSIFKRYNIFYFCGQFVFAVLNYVCINVAICDPVHDVVIVFHLC